MINALKQIIKDLGVYPIDTTNKKRPYPFATYNISNIVTNVTEDGNLKSGDDISYLTTQPQMVLSINSYSDNEIEAIEEARRLYHYFKYHNDLDEVNATVVNVEDVMNRSVLIVDRYEYRYGFDVYIRYVDKLEKENFTIEIGSVNIKHD